MPTPFFADLVRELCHEGGAGPLTPTGAVPGHRRFADAVPVDTPFHYAIAGIAQPAQWEVGLGRIDSDGRLVRDTVASSSNGGGAVDFAPGLKTIALTASADWFAASDAAAAALTQEVAGAAATIEGKQPLSTGHAAAVAGAASDLVTVRREGGWVNLPLSAFVYRDAAGNFGINAGAPAANLHLSSPAGRRMAIFDAASGASDAERAMRFHIGGTHFASIAVPAGSGGALGFCTGNGEIIPVVERLRIERDGHTRPGADNAQSLGQAAYRWSVAYAATGAINTSDARDKQWRGGPDAAERRAAARIGAELGFYRWLDRIAAKGAANARLHFGARAQAVWSIMADEGLVDPPGADGRPGRTPYAFLCWDEWDAEIGEDGEIRRAAGNRFGIRPDQLALFLIAAQEARIAALEAAA